jgi:hypothetical protein
MPDRNASPTTGGDPAEFGAIVRFTAGTDQPVDQSAERLATRWAAIRRDGSWELLEATCAGHTVYLNPNLITTVVPA